MNELEKIQLQQRDRMQDMVLNYATLAVKAVILVSGGALVSTGAALINLPLETKKQEFIHAVLGNAFFGFSWALALMLSSLLTIYIGRVFYMAAMDVANENHKKFHNEAGYLFEYLSLHIVCVALVFFFKALILLNSIA